MRILALKPTCIQTLYNMITTYALTTGIDLTGAIIEPSAIVLSTL